MNKFILGLVVPALSVGFVQANPVDKINYNLVSLNSTTKKMVERDQMTVIVYVTEEGRTPSELTKKVTEKTNEVIRLVKAQKQLTITQRSRQSIRLAKKTFGDQWEERSTLVIEGKDFGAINKILGRITNIARIDNVYYSVSKDARERLEDDLLTDGLKKITTQANLVMESMKKPKFRLVSMNVNNNTYNDRPFERNDMRLSAAPLAKATISEAAAGNEEVSLNINAQVQLYGAADPSSGQINYNMINFSEAARETVERDQMTVRLAVMEEGTNPVALTQKVTEKANYIIRMAKENKNLSIAQTSRTSKKVERKTFSGDVWAETSVLTLESKDFAGVNQILANVDKNAQISGVAFSVSTETKEKLEGALTKEALARLNKKSILIAKTLGLTNFHLVNMGVSYNGDDRPNNFLGLMGAGSSLKTSDEEESIYVPESAAGQTDLTVNVNAQVQLYGQAK